MLTIMKKRMCFVVPQTIRIPLISVLMTTSAFSDVQRFTSAITMAVTKSLIVHAALKSISVNTLESVPLFAMSQDAASPFNEIIISVDIRMIVTPTFAIMHVHTEDVVSGLPLHSVFGTTRRAMRKRTNTDVPAIRHVMSNSERNPLSKHTYRNTTLDETLMPVRTTTTLLVNPVPRASKALRR